MSPSGGGWLRRVFCVTRVGSWWWGHVVAWLLGARVGFPDFGAARSCISLSGAVEMSLFFSWWARGSGPLT